MKNCKVSYLVLDFNRPVESSLCLKSIKEYTKFPYELIYLSNGGNQDYVWDFYRSGLIDKVVFNKENSGLGFGTTDLFKLCKTEWALYVQNDQFLGRDYTEEELDQQIAKLEEKDSGVASIALAGDPCKGEYSERAHLINVDFYNSIPNKPNGGAGPYHHIEWNEGYIQNYYKENDLVHHIWPNLLFGDNGAWSHRVNPDGSMWCHRTDLKKLWMIKPPTEKYVYPKFTDEEWEEVLKTGKWEDGAIPEEEKDQSFEVWL